jgi:hypothetical protein
MEEGQTQNNFEDTKRVIRICKWKKARHKTTLKIPKE